MVSGMWFSAQSDLFPLGLFWPLSFVPEPWLRRSPSVVRLYLRLALTLVGDSEQVGRRGRPAASMATWQGSRVRMQISLGQGFLAGSDSMERALPVSCCGEQSGHQHPGNQVGEKCRAPPQGSVRTPCSARGSCVPLDLVSPTLGTLCVILSKERTLSFCLSRAGHPPAAYGVRRGFGAPRLSELTWSSPPIPNSASRDTRRCRLLTLGEFVGRNHVSFWLSLG